MNDLSGYFMSKSVFGQHVRLSRACLCVSCDFFLYL